MQVFWVVIEHIRLSYYLLLPGYMSQPPENLQSESFGVREERHVLSWSAALLVTCLALGMQWQLSDFCWAIWLTEVVVVATVFFVSFGKILLFSLGLRPLLPSEQLPDDTDFRQLCEATPLKRSGMMITSCAIIVFLVLICFAFFAMYGLLLHFLFPLSGLPYSGSASVLAFCLLMLNIILILLPECWPMVLVTILVERHSLFSGPPSERILELIFVNKNLMKIHFALLLGVPIALIVQGYLAQWERVILILLIFVFYLRGGKRC